ncbi:adenylate/guanylate cyclase domain-containing protein [Argonema antarcticum]|uniref:adenylate/guanylate cyclase domain-containing protein n=1 Tax=Argonema antarcticum TaxID=2942763 RepID=UPI002011373F|nr:adenylate/guanylate cyclase domain-containing protein [Argonema antarcticum]MCL1473739.1 HAMP domain-containing protein [Argonema antarcticum A004/B2]
MKLRQKTLLVIGLSLVGLVGVLYATAYIHLMKHTHDLEVDYTTQGVKRALDALDEDVSNLSIVVRQLGAWDDTYNFMVDSNNRYLKTNLSNQTFADFRLNTTVLINTSGRWVFKKGFDLKYNKEILVSKGLQEHLKAKSLLLQHTTPKSSHKGIVLLPEGLLLIASHPVVTNKFDSPIHGTLVMGRYLDAEEIQRLATLTQLSISIHPLNNVQLPPNLQAMSSALAEKEKQEVVGEIPNPKSEIQNGEILVRPLDENAIAGYTILKDIYGKPALLMEVKFPRIIYNQGKASLIYLLFSLLGAGFVFGIGNLLLLEKMVLSRLARLSDGVKSIGKSGDLSLRVSSAGEDELSSLGRTINWMLETLESSLKQLKSEQEKAEHLLLNILPSAIAERLKKEESIIADSFAEATVLFADIVGFTKLAARTSPVELVSLLNQIFSAFDRLVELHGLEKIKTIGDAYMVVGGLPTPRPDHAVAVAEMAIDMQEAIKQFNVANNVDFSIRIGINTGPVVAGVIGIKKFIYDLWGDTVNTASRMESHGLAGCIQMTEATYKCLKDKFDFENRGVIQVKGKGDMTVYLLLAKKAIARG